MHTEQIEHKKTDILFKHAKHALLTSPLFIGIITFVLWEHASTPVLVAWITAILTANAARYLLIHKYKQAPAETENKKHWRRHFNTGAFITGALWGFLGIYAIHTQPLPNTAIMILLISYMAMSSSVNYSIFISSFLAFSLPLTAPVVFYLLIQADTILQTYGVLLSIFFIYSIFSASRHRLMTDSYIIYEVNNTALLNSLEKKQAEATRLNTTLKEDLRKIRLTEEQLKQEKNKAETLAKELRAISTRDGLTGIANRRSFDEFLGREWNRAVRSQKPLSLIICDIDHFKPYNDYFGHQEGDKCLIRVAQTLDEYARRGGDLAARYGGEEFAIILPETSLENAAELAEQIRRAILDAAIMHPASDTENVVTMSFGVATIVPRRGQASNTLIAIADKALYQAKQTDRNRVVPARPGLMDHSHLEQEG